MAKELENNKNATTENNENATTENNENATTENNEKNVSLQTIYIKDLSFEAPNSPEVFLEQEITPETKLNISNAHRKLSEGVYDVSLKLSVESTYGEKTMFLAEVEQAGVFAIRGYDETETRALIGIFCPNTLFPYIRELISTMVTKAGFPALLLQPINFDSIYSHAMEQASEQKPN